MRVKRRNISTYMQEVTTDVLKLAMRQNTGKVPWSLLCVAIAAAFSSGADGVSSEAGTCVAGNPE